MHISIYIPDALTQKLKTYILKKGNNVSTNEVIIEALEKFLSKEEAQKEWSKEVLNWQGVPEFEFEREQDWKEFSF